MTDQEIYSVDQLLAMPLTEAVKPEGLASDIIKNRFIIRNDRCNLLISSSISLAKQSTQVRTHLERMLSGEGKQSQGHFWIHASGKMAVQKALQIYAEMVHTHYQGLLLGEIYTDTIPHFKKTLSVDGSSASSTSKYGVHIKFIPFPE
ncbi:hypothetical protein Ciccas_008772 [Cichlidogyrus casuarinus]|uniref:Uncharacterized protein n=1 Tax=Cichlidogyrus casuarinus TaxID=1844966 RepID=A0ABD2PYY4_9PLAT